MLEALKSEKIVEKVGGRFKLSTLIQKRIVQLKQGSRPLVDTQTDNMMELVMLEILQDKITLDTENQVHTPEGETSVTDVPNINPLEL
jgi:DNA-directed RNA polymerase subunit omega